MATLTMEEIFTQLSVSELNSFKKLLDSHIKEASSLERKHISTLDIDDFVDFHKCYLDQNEIHNVIADSEAVITNHLINVAANHVKTVWLTHTNLEYTWTNKAGRATKNKPVPLKGHTAIETLLNRINDDLGTQLNSCLVHYYKDGTDGIRLHADNEDVMDSNQPIVVVSFGANRNVEFLHKYQQSTEKPVKVVESGEGSMYCMKPGTQTFYRHRVPSNRRSNGMRISLSFRRAITPPAKYLVVPCEKCDSLSSASDISSLPVLDRSALPNKVDKATSIIAPIKVDTATSPALQLPPLSEVFLPSTQLTNTSPEHSIPDSDHKRQQTTSHTAKPQHTKLPVDGKQRYRDTHPGQNNPQLQSRSPPVGEQKRQRATPPQRHTQNSTVQPSTTLIIGSSITKFINAERLTRGSGKKCINLSKSGAKVKDCASMIVDFVQSNNDLNIERVIVSIGTNDVKLFKQDTNRFWVPLKDLIFKVRSCFGPNVSIVFQAVLPMKCMYTYTPSNFFGFNNLLIRLCRRFNCEYIDCFNDFLDCNGRDINRFLYRDHLHLNTRGLEILAKHLKNVIVPNLHMNTDFCFT